MTHEWKNDRYEGALDEGIEIDVFYDDSEGLRRGSHSAADVLVNSFNVNEGTRNLLAGAAINAKRREELEEEVAQLKSEYAYLESFLKDGKMYCQNCPQTQGRNMLHWSEWEGDVSETLTLEVPSKDYDRLTRAASELAALKAKYTPRPMSEAPRDGSYVYLFTSEEWGAGEYLNIAFWNDERDLPTGWTDMHLVPVNSCGDLLGWLPADTFKGDING